VTGTERSPIATGEPIEEFAAIGVVAFTTTRATGSLGLGSTEPVVEVMGRWSRLMDDCRAVGAPALATAGQVHGAAVEVHGGGWRGWLRGKDRDGHVTAQPGIALAVTIADCTPVYLAHPGGAIGVLHAGWRGVAAGMLESGLEQMRRLGAPADELLVHFGPAICGRCYEVGPEVIAAVSGESSPGPRLLDLRANLAARAERAGVRQLRVSQWCTKCHNDRFFSHRAGDAGRQMAVILRPGADAPNDEMT
jgi:YfiH family protein